MRKLVSFSVFAVIVILSLIAKNTVEAQVVVRPTVVAPVAVLPLCPGPGYVWRRGVWVMRPRYRYHMGYGVRWHARPIRNRRYGW